MASIEKRGVNSWRLVVETGYDANTKRLKRCKSIKIDGPALLKTIPIFFISSAAPKKETSHKFGKLMRSL